MPETVTETKTDPVTQTTQKPATLDLDAKVKIDGKEVTVAQLLQAAKDLEATKAEATSLKEYRDHTRKLLRGEETPATEREASMRYVLKEQGYEPEEIEEYVTAAMNQGQQTQQTTTKEEPDELAILKARLDAQEKQQQEAALQNLKRGLKENTDRQVDSDPQLTVLFNKIKELRGDEGLKEARASIREEIQEKTVKFLKMRVAATGQNVTDEWIGEEARKAAQAVHKSYLSVIGDPNKIKRAPETVTGEDILKSKKPVPTPEYTNQDDMGTLSVKTREWGIDMLSRAAAEEADTGASKV